MNKKAIEYAKIFNALSHPLRLQIACGLLKHKRCNVNTMVARTGVAQALVSQHVKNLKDSGIIEGTRDGNIIWYTLCSPQTIKLLTNANLDICQCNDCHDEREHKLTDECKDNCKSE